MRHLMDLERLYNFAIGSDPIRESVRPRIHEMNLAGSWRHLLPPPFRVRCRPNA